MRNGVKTKIDLAVLQEKVDNIEEHVREIRDNHLPHIHTRLDSVEQKLAYYAGGIVAAISLIELAIRFIK